MKVRLTCKDGVKQIHYINPNNYDPKRMEIIDEIQESRDDMSWLQKHATYWHNKANNSMFAMQKASDTWEHEKGI